MPYSDDIARECAIHEKKKLVKSNTYIYAISRQFRDLGHRISCPSVPADSDNGKQAYKRCN